MNCHVAHSIIAKRRVWGHLGWRDLKVRYSATLFGPWWSVTNLLVLVSASSLAVSLIAESSLIATIPRIAVGFILWTFISSSLVDATSAFEQSRGLLLNTTIDEIVIVYRVIWRNVVILLHNFFIVASVFLLLDRRALFNSLLILPVTGLAALALVFPALLVSRIVYWRPALRAMIPPMLQFVFYLTPVLWVPPSSGPAVLLVELNPVAWILQFVDAAVLRTEIRWGLLLRLLFLLGLSLTATELFHRKRQSIKKQL